MSLLPKEEVQFNRSDLRRKQVQTAVLIMVRLIKETTYFVSGFNQRFHSSIFYKILTRTTQPAHVVALLIATIVVSILWPNLVYSGNTVTNSDEASRMLSKHVTLLYLGIFATHFGTQIWMTFVSGLSLYFNLPRHLFGQCQQILFPRYFAINSFLSLVTLIIFVKIQGQTWILSTYVQVFALSLCAVLEITVRLYLAPPMLRLLCEKYRMELQEGAGKEIGKFDFKDLLQKCAKFKQVHTTFRKYHTAIAMANLVTVVCTFVHLHYLASKIVSI